jgi:hypothetical protein
MQTSSSFRRGALLALALGAASATTAFAQTTPTPADASTATTPATTASTPATGTGAKHQHHHSVLDPAESAELRNARNAAFAANPALKAEHDSLEARAAALRSQGASASQDDKAKLHADHEAFATKLHAAELAADPGLGPVLSKLEYAHKHHHHSAA